MQDLDCQTIIIFGKQGHGKTLFGIVEASPFILFAPHRFFANFSVYVNEKKVGKYIQTTLDIESIEYDDNPGICIIDESSFNFSNDSKTTDKSKAIKELFLLMRKRNISCIFIWQRYMMISIDARELCDLVYEMEKIRRVWDYPLFLANKQEPLGGDILRFDWATEVDLIGFLQKMKISYDTKEASVIK